MTRLVCFVVAGMLLTPVSLTAQLDHYKTVALTPFANAAQVGLPQRFTQDFDDGVRDQLLRSKLAGHVVDGNYPPPAPQTCHCYCYLRVEGKFLKIKEGHWQRGKFKNGFAIVEIDLYVPGDRHPSVRTKPKIPLKGSLEDHEQLVATQAGVATARWIRQSVLGMNDPIDSWAASLQPAFGSSSAAPPAPSADAPPHPSAVSLRAS